MASHEARRGRPKGTGLDDRVQLRRITDMLARDPSLKPTTAIKALGISDPSVIRRLREKLKAEPLGFGEREVASSYEAPVMAMARPEETSPPVHNPTSVGGPVASSTASAGSFAETDQTPWLAQWCAFGLSAVSSTIEAQLSLMHGLLETPQVQSALRQQLLFNEVAKALCPKRSDIQTLH